MMLNAELPLTKKKLTCAIFFFFWKDHLRIIRHPYVWITQLRVPFLTEKKSKIADCTFDHLRIIRHPYVWITQLCVPFLTEKKSKIADCNSDHLRKKNFKTQIIQKKGTHVSELYSYVCHFCLKKWHFFFMKKTAHGKHLNYAFSYAIFSEK